MEGSHGGNTNREKQRLMAVGTRISLKDSIATRMLLVILGLYLLVAMTITLSHVLVEYKYQKENIIQDLEDIEQAFENGLAVSLWGLDQQALQASVEGMLRIPTLVGVKISNLENTIISIGGIIIEQNKTGRVGLHVNISGCSDEEKTVHGDELYSLEIFQRQFSITYDLEGEKILLGQATLYSNSSVIYRRMKLQVVMLLVNLVLTLLTFSMALLWVVNRYLRKPLGILTNAMEDISLNSLGSFSIDTRASRRNEIKVLEESINFMVADLNAAISKQNETQASLRERELYLSSIFRAAPIGIGVSIDKKLIQLNDQIYKMTGYTEEELMGQNAEILYQSNDDYEQIARRTYKQIQGHGIGILETCWKQKNEGIINVLVSSTPLDRADPMKGITFAVLDITEKVKIEQQLRQSQKMESIGTLAGGIAHDFNNILFPILGHTEMLLQDIPEDSSTHHGLEKIYSGAIRARDLVSQILTFSRQENGDLKLTKIQPILKEALKLIRATIPTTIQIKQDIQSKGGAIKADSTQIHQIIMNLITNAFHAMERTGGELMVSLEEMEIGPLDLINPDITPGVYACLSIADTGVGMDKNLTDKIFDPFFTTKEKGKGTGMGLSVVHGIVKSMGGSIHVYSEPGKGSEFRVYLPVAKSPYEEQATHSKTKIQGGTEQILLVDDEKEILTMERQVLERLGYQVTSHSNSIQALETFKDSPKKFDLVITDMAMPNMPGDKLSFELVKIRPDIPVLLCTGFSETMSEEKAASLGIRGFLLKPIVMKNLSQKIREVLKKKTDFD